MTASRRGTLARAPAAPAVSASPTRPQPAPLIVPPWRAVPWRAWLDQGSTWWARRGAPVFATGAALLAIVFGCLSLGPDALDAYRLTVATLLALSVLSLTLATARAEGRPDPLLLLLCGLTLIALCILGALPSHFGRYPVNAVFHRSLASSALLVGLGIPCAGVGLFYLLGATPRAADVARYPLIVVPVVLALAAYVLLLADLLARGLPQLEWAEIVRPYSPPRGAASAQSGFRNHILGTALLVFLTALISLPIGVGTGIYLSQFARGRLAQVVRFSTTALRGVSVFVLGLTALNLLGLSMRTPLQPLLVAVYPDPLDGTPRAGEGTFLLGALVVSMLVVPVISRATEEGCRSLPEGMRAGSLALGASEDYTLRRLVLPWAAPSIVTGLLLGCAEAAGSVVTLLFVASAGEHGVFGPLSEVTSLAYAVFAGYAYRSKPFRDQMGPSQNQEGGAVLLLVVVLAITAGALALKARFAARYRGV